MINLDWRRLKAVVLESDDWGLCAWVPDEQAHRVVADTPAWRSAPGRAYGRSTLESAADVDQLSALLLEFRGGDGLPPVWQANTVLAAPDYAQLQPPLFEHEAIPLVDLPATPSRWPRPGLWEAVTRSRDAGVWWPELHGLHHVPEQAWLTALRRGVADARRAHEHQSFVCEAVEASGEYDPSEPRALRLGNLARAVEKFRALFGRDPGSFCPPDYRWDEAVEQEAERLGVMNVQGKAEQVGRPLARLRRLFSRLQWPDVQGRRFFLPPRIAFEPRGSRDPNGRVGTNAAHARARGAWGRGQPAVISSHRLNYAHLDAAWVETGRDQLRDLLGRLVADGAVFFTDLEVRQLLDRAWSLRAVGTQGALLRYHGVPREAIRFAAPAGTLHVALKDGIGEGTFAVEGGEVRAQLDPGDYLLEWRLA